MAKVRVAINGFGRIGRNVVRAIYESGRKDIDIVSINDLGPVETNAHLLRYDSVHGRFPHDVTTKGDSISIGTDTFKVTAVKDPTQLPQKDWALTSSGMHRHFHVEGQGLGPSHRRRQARHRFGTMRWRRLHHRLRRQPRHADEGPHGHFECVVHHQLPRSRGQGVE